MSPLNDRAKAIIQHSIQKFVESGFEPTGVSNYDDRGLIAQAMAKAGTVDDTQKIVQTLRDGEWDTIFGGSRPAGTNISP